MCYFQISRIIIIFNFQISRTMILQQNLFSYEIEEQEIERIVRFSKIADSLGLDICLRFSGGKDSQVVYHLMQRSGVTFKAYYNVERLIIQQF